ncbi:MAG: hypothetical protein EOP84_25695 [Verrucomicrobiaceae bacterium]|nr:MAG: hypothetical protein EOP84_25695 [Verrucomicrobiaceae bacterium]
MIVAGDTYTARMEPGQYNATNACAELTRALNAAISVNFAVTYDEEQRRLVINAGVPFQVRPGTSGSSAWRWAGISRTNMSDAATEQKLGVADFTATSPVLLCSGTLTSRFNKLVGAEAINCLAVLDTSQTAQGSWISYDNSGGRFFQADQHLSQLDFVLVDASSLLPIDMTLPYFVSIGILTDEVDAE